MTCITKQRLIYDRFLQSFLNALMIVSSKFRENLRRYASS